MTHPNQEPQRGLLHSAAYAVAGIAFSVGGYAALDAGPTLSAQRQAEVSLAQLDACKQGSRTLDSRVITTDADIIEDAYFCGGTRVVLQSDGVTPDWDATRHPAMEQFDQSLIFPDPNEVLLYKACGLLGALAGLGVAESSGRRAKKTAHRSTRTGSR